MSELIHQGLEKAIYKGISNYRFTNNPEDLFHYSTFFEDTEQFLLKEQNCAEYFLNQILAGKHLLNDKNAVAALLKLYSAVKPSHGTFPSLKSLLVQTLEYIETNINDVMNVDIVDMDDMADDLGWYYSVSPYCMVVNAIGMVRQHAFAEYVRQMAKHLKTFPDITNLYGENSLIISNVKDERVQQCLGAIKENYGERIIANFTPVEEGKWRFSLPELGPEENFIFAQAAYKNVADMLAFCLMADVELSTWLEH